MTARPAAPVERVRRRLSATLDPAQLRSVPGAYERLGRVLVVRLPDSLRPNFAEIGAAYQAELGVTTVLQRSGPVAGEHRTPSVEVIAGGPTETEVVENGIRYRLDAARVMFSAGNRAERARAGRLVRPGEHVADLFAGVGYFTLPAAVVGRASRVAACELNPVSYRLLLDNLRVNRVLGRVEAFLGDNRQAPLAEGAFDRVFLGLLPTAVPWVDRALPLLRPSGGWLHVHAIESVRAGEPRVEDEVQTEVARLGSAVRTVRSHEVKPYGPGRRHVVVDVAIAPIGRDAAPTPGSN